MTEKPVIRSPLRLKAGTAYFGLLRRLLWLRMGKSFALEKRTAELPFVYFSHQTPLRRSLANVDMWMQENKIINLRLASERLDCVILRPGEIFSYWRTIGKPSRRKGYADGMVLVNGAVSSGLGGGLCQLSNLIFWMALHTPLTVIERHRHGWDVFPDSDRTQPFGSGATCAYPHVDLMIKNNTEDEYQLRVNVGEDFLKGQWRVSSEPEYRFEVVERNHEMRSEYWGGYTRHNELFRQRFDRDGRMLEESFLVRNEALMMYSPFLPESEIFG